MNKIERERLGGILPRPRKVRVGSHIRGASGRIYEVVDISGTSVRSYCVYAPPESPISEIEYYLGAIHFFDVTIKGFPHPTARWSVI